MEEAQHQNELRQRQRHGAKNSTKHVVRRKDRKNGSWAPDAMEKPRGKSPITEAPGGLLGDGRAWDPVFNGNLWFL